MRAATVEELDWHEMFRREGYVHVVAASHWTAGEDFCSALIKDKAGDRRSRFTPGQVHGELLLPL